MHQNIDPRLIVPSYINKPDVRFFDVDLSPFTLHGVSRFGDSYLRLPPDLAASLNPRAKKFSAAAAGGRVRFKTNSSYIAIRAHLGDIYRISMMTLTATAGFDLYEGEEFLGAFNPPYELQCGGAWESVVNLGERRERELTLNMPPYSTVMELEVGIDGEATLSECSPYSIERPIVFYGSSITHGACASRPGTAFTHMLSRMLNADIINLGFGAGCRGEVELGKHIAELSPALLVCAYDHNAPNAAKLSETHEAFFKAVREAAPGLPIILVTRPDVKRNAEGDERYSIIERTFKSALAAGDKSVYLVDGRTLLSSPDLTQDGIHPGDMGQRELAYKLEPIIKEALSFSK